MAHEPIKFAASSLARAAQTVRSGGLIVYPTDTVYGLGCDPTKEAAVDRLFAAKKREAKPIPLMCGDFETASKLVEFSPKAVELARRFWPGALTIVSPLTATLPFPIHQGSGTLGVRVPGLALCRKLVTMCGGVLTGTSANVSGQGPCRTAEESYRELGKAVDMILDGGRLAGAESTVVRVDGEKIEVLRQGTLRVTEKESLR